MQKNIYTFALSLPSDKRNAAALVGDGQSRASVTDSADDAPTVAEVHTRV